MVTWWAMTHADGERPDVSAPEEAAGCAFILFVVAAYLGAGIGIGYLIWGHP